MSSPVIESISFFNRTKKTRGEISSWSDNLLVFVRDKMRRIERNNRGKWTIEFYEKLQKVNRESQRRGLKQHTL